MESSLTADAAQVPAHSAALRVSFHLSGLPTDITVDELNKRLGQATQNCKVELLPSRPPYSRVSALIHFEDSQLATAFYGKNKYIEIRDQEFCLTQHQQHFNKEIRKWNLFVEGIPNSWKSSTLDNLFSQQGTVLSCKVEKKGDGSMTKTIGWVQMTDQNSSKNAILAHNGKEVQEDGKVFTLKVSFSQYRKECSVHVSNIPVTLFSQSVLADVFSHFGEVESVSLKPEAMHPYAFVNFYTQQAARAALQGAKNLTLPQNEPNQLQVHPHITTHGSPRSPYKGHGGMQSSYQHKPSNSKSQFQNSNVFVQPIPDTVDEATLKEKFQEFGTIKSVLLLPMRNQFGFKRGYVLFEKSEQAFNAIRKLDGNVLWKVRVSVRLYESHQERHKYDNFSSSSSYNNPIQNLFTNLYQMMYNAQAFQMPSQGYGNYHQYGGQHHRGGGGYRQRGGGMNRGHGFYPRGGMPHGRGQAYLQQQTVLPGPRTAPPLSSYEALPGHHQEVQNEQIQQLQGSSLVNKLAVMSEADRKQYIGNAFYPKVQKQYPDFAGKITGMLVDIPLEQAVTLLSDDIQLEKIVIQAYESLQTASTASQASQ